MLMTRRLAEKKAIREAIDSYPGGLVFANSDGKLILVNQQMNKLIEILTGHTLINVNIAWQELLVIREQNGCIRLDGPWLRPDIFGGDGSSIIFSYPDEKIWLFRKQLLTDREISTIQVEAADITKLYHMSEELYRNNQRLEGVKRRQIALLSNIVQINRDRELLSAKMRIHDELGRCIVATKNTLGHGTIDHGGYRELMDSWKEAIRNMENVSFQGTVTSPEKELRKVADMIGCKLCFVGQQPVHRRSLLLLYSAIREALTNSVRHASASCLTVTMSASGGMYHAVISSNGASDVTEIRETGGLKSLRKLLEQNGASLGYTFGGSVSVVVDIPELN